VLQPPAPTLQVAQRVPVYLDTPEMDLPVQVNRLKFSSLDKLTIA